MVDLVAAETPVAPNTATATKGLLAGGTYTSTQPTLTTTQQAALAFTARNAVIVAPGADSFAVQATLNAETTKVIGTVNQGTSPWVISGAVTNAGTFATQSAITAASGSIASGAVSAGAYVSGSVLSGAFASGSLAAGSMVDLLTMRGAVGAGTAPADALIGGAIYNSTPITVTNTQSAALQSDANGFLKVNVAASVLPTGAATAANQTADPCSSANNKTNVAFTTNGTSSVQLVALSGSTTIYVCALHYIAAGATTVAFTTGTGTACVTGNAAVIGSTTANIANSMSYAANGGETYGNGSGTIAKGAASSEFCMVNGTNVYVSGNLVYVQQ
jgi:hypothetical protein